LNINHETIKPATLRANGLCKYTGLSKSWIYEEIAQGRFPSGVRISSGIVLWRTEDVDAWLNDRLQGDA